jgi:hypothetical protein
MPAKNARQGAVQGLKDIYAGNSPYNAFDFIVRMIMNNDLATALPAKVLATYSEGSGAPAGKVDVLPLVCQTDAEGNAIGPAAVYSLPYMRLQGGKAAIVVDPEPGDIGLAVFAKQDVSNLAPGTTEPVQPGSFRSFDMADGFYIGGFLNKAPQVFIELKQNGSIAVTAPGNVTVTAPNVTVSGDVVAGGISLVNHVHSNCGGPSNSGPPVG